MLQEKGSMSGFGQNKSVWSVTLVKFMAAYLFLRSSEERQHVESLNAVLNNLAIIEHCGYSRIPWSLFH